MGGLEDIPVSGSPGRRPGFALTLAGFAGLSWLVALPVLAAGSACFWAAGGAGGPIPAPVFAAASSLLMLAAFAATAAAQVRRALAQRTSSRLPLVLLRASAVGLVSLVAASLLGMLPWLHVEAISPFDRTFETGHLLAASAVSLAAFGAWTYVRHLEGGSRPVRLAGAAVLALAGVAAWYRASAFAYDTVRGSYADSAILLLHTIAFVGLLLACVINGVRAALQAR